MVYFYLYQAGTAPTKMSFPGCSSSNQEAAISAEMMGLKAYQEESGLRRKWKKEKRAVSLTIRRHVAMTQRQKLCVCRSVLFCP